jgi:hypothetical protein
MADPIAELRDRVLLIDAGSRDTCAVVARLMDRVAALERASEAQAKSRDGFLRADPAPENTCVIRWEDPHWVVREPDPVRSGLHLFSELAMAIAIARAKGLRVTNDPREGTLRESTSCAGLWRFEGADRRKYLAGDSLKQARQVCAERSWRILSEVPAPAGSPCERDCIVVSDYGMNAYQMTLSEAQAYLREEAGCGPLAPGMRIMRLVPVDD